MYTYFQTLCFIRQVKQSSGRTLARQTQRANKTALPSCGLSERGLVIVMVLVFALMCLLLVFGMTDEGPIALKPDDVTRHPQMQVKRIKFVA